MQGDSPNLAGQPRRQGACGRPQRRSHLQESCERRSCATRCHTSEPNPSRTWWNMDASLMSSCFMLLMSSFFSFLDRAFWGCQTIEKNPSYIRTQLRPFCGTLTNNPFGSFWACGCLRDTHHIPSFGVPHDTQQSSSHRPRTRASAVDATDPVEMA